MPRSTSESGWASPGAHEPPRATATTPSTSPSRSAICRASFARIIPRNHRRVRRDEGYTNGVDLFDEPGSESLRLRAPLAERLRPKTLDEVVGQAHLTGENGPLRAAVDRGRIDSLI